jgi:hypothetical protein
MKVAGIESHVVQTLGIYCWVAMSWSLVPSIRCAMGEYVPILFGRGPWTRGGRAAPQCCVGATHRLQACHVRGSDGDYAGINGAGRVLGDGDGA